MNEIKQKEIEEMAKVLDEIEAIMWENAAYDTPDMAKSFYEAGYRNCKDKVVLTEEEYAELKQTKTLLELREETIKYLEDANIRYAKALELKVNEKERQETAREIIEYLRDNGRKYEVWYLVSELRKQYGVEE